MAEHHHTNPVTEFTFATTFEGKEISVTVVFNEGHYGVLFNGKLAAQVELDDDGQTWFVADGEIADKVLVHEIGERIEAQLY